MRGGGGGVWKDLKVGSKAGGRFVVSMNGKGKMR